MFIFIRRCLGVLVLRSLWLGEFLLSFVFIFLFFLSLSLPPSFPIFYGAV